MDLLSIPASLALSAALVFLLRNWISTRIRDSIKHEYDCKLELVRSEAKQANDLELEKVKYELSLKLKEVEIKTNWLQQKMATEIDEIYKLLWDFRNKVHSHVTIYQGGEYKDHDRVHDVFAAYWKFVKEFNLKRIYLPQETVKEIEGFISTLRGKSAEFHKNVVVEKDPEKEIDNWQEINEYMENDASKLFEILEENFRTLLGHYYKKGT